MRNQIPAGPSQRTWSSTGQVPPPMQSTDGMVLAIILLLVGSGSFIAFLSHGAIGTDEGIKRGGILLLSNALILVYVLAARRRLGRPPALFAVLVLWSAWVACLSVHLSPYGAREVLKALMEVMYCPLFFFAAYTAVYSRPHRVHLLTWFFFGLLAMNATLFFFVMQFQRTIVLGNDLAQLNDVYYVLLLLPWSMLITKRYFRIMAFAIIATLVLWSFKRTAIIALAAAFLVYSIADIRIRGKRVSRLRVLIPALIAMTGIFFLYKKVDEASHGHISARMSAIQDDEGSGRLDIYESFWYEQSRRPVQGWILGSGHDGFRRDQIHVGSRGNPISAHNDWIEVLYDYGLPGFILFALMNACIIGKTIHMIRHRYFHGPSMLASYVIFFIMTMTSHLVLYPTYFLYLTAFWGTAFALHTQSVDHMKPLRAEPRAMSPS